MTTKTFNTFLQDETAMAHFGAQLSQCIPAKLLIYLAGDLGMGKTTLVRGFLRSLGHKGRVKSPTYTLVEPYEIDGKSVYHFDLYRLAHPEELEMIGVSEYLSEDAVCIMEWPEKGEGVLPEPDLLIKLDIQGQGRSLDMSAPTLAGKKILEQFFQ